MLYWRQGSRNNPPWPLKGSSCATSASANFATPKILESGPSPTVSFFQDQLLMALRWVFAKPFMEVSLGLGADDLPIGRRHKALVEVHKDNSGAHCFDAGLWSCPARSWRFDAASEQAGEQSWAEGKLGANFAGASASLRATVGPDKKYGILLGGASQDSGHCGLLVRGAQHNGSKDVGGRFEGFNALVVYRLGRPNPRIEVARCRFPLFDGDPHSASAAG